MENEMDIAVATVFIDNNRTRVADHKINRIDELLPWNYRTGD